MDESGTTVNGSGIGDFGAWYEIEARTITKALGLALGDFALAEEATAEAFMKAFARWDQVRAMSSPVGWVYRVALNEARMRNRRQRLEDRFSRRRARPPEAAAAPDPDDRLWAAVGALPERARMAIALRYIADLSETEIAQLMGIARGTVAATLSTARRQLASRLASDKERVET